jgi:hypothetical protein
MNFDRFPQLKQKVLQGADFSDTWTFYMDHFADLPEFTDLGEPKECAFLEAAVPKICQQMFKSARRIEMMPIYIAEYQFFHSPLQVDRRIGGVIYFEDVKVGLLAVSDTFPPTDLVRYSRFKA